MNDSRWSRGSTTFLLILPLYMASSSGSDGACLALSAEGSSCGGLLGMCAVETRGGSDAAVRKGVLTSSGIILLGPLSSMRLAGVVAITCYIAAARMSFMRMRMGVGKNTDENDGAVGENEGYGNNVFHSDEGVASYYETTLSSK
jgi:hypothetical protein